MISLLFYERATISLLVLPILRAISILLLFYRWRRWIRVSSFGTRRRLCREVFCSSPRVPGATDCSSGTPPRSRATTRPTATLLRDLGVANHPCESYPLFLCATSTWIWSKDPLFNAEQSVCLKNLLYHAYRSLAGMNLSLFCITTV